MSQEVSTGLRFFSIIEEPDGLDNPNDTFDQLQPFQFISNFPKVWMATSNIGIAPTTHAPITLQQALAELANATTVQEVSEIAASLSAAATGPGGAVLYSGSIGSTKAENIAVAIAKANNLSIINNTIRAQFLDNEAVEAKLATIFRGLHPTYSTAQIDNLVGQELFAGNSSSLWGQASEAFAQSIKGAVTIVASDANQARILYAVEIPELLLNKSITSINNIAIASLPKTSAGLAAAIVSSFDAALKAGGVFATAETETLGQLVALQTLEKLGLSTVGAKTVAQYLAEGLLESSAANLETIAAVNAETILASAGVKALGLLGNALKLAGGVFFGVLVGVLDGSKPLDGGTDEQIAEQDAEWLAQDTAAADQTSLVTTDSNGTSVVNVPLVNSAGTIHDQYVLAENPTAQTVTLAVATNNDSTLLLSSGVNGQPVLDEKIVDSLPNNAYDNQISITTNANGIINVDVKIEKNDTVTVGADETLTGVTQDFSFKGSASVLQIDTPADFTGTISNFAPTDIIDVNEAPPPDLEFGFADTILGDVTLNLTISNGVFYAKPDGNGGTAIGLIAAVNVTPPDAVATWISGTSAAGQIFGTYSLVNGTQFGFIDDDGKYTKVKVPTSLDTRILGVDNAGDFAGEYVDINDKFHGFYESNGSYVEINAPNAYANSTQVYGISAGGEVFGTYTPQNNESAQYGYTEKKRNLHDNRTRRHVTVWNKRSHFVGRSLRVLYRSCIVE